MKIMWCTEHFASRRPGYEVCWAKSDWGNYPGECEWVGKHLEDSSWLSDLSATLRDQYKEKIDAIRGDKDPEDPGVQ